VHPLSLSGRRAVRVVKTIKGHQYLYEQQTYREGYRRSPTLPRQHHVDIPAAAPRADKPIAPIEHRDAYAVTLREFGGIRLDLTLAGLAPYDDADAGSGRTA